MIKSFKEFTPRISPDAFVAENAVIIGNVSIAPRVSVWYGVTIRGDINSIEIGEETNIQDHAVVHVDRKTESRPYSTPQSPPPADFEEFGSTKIGRRVTVGHGAILHACHIDDDCLIGMGAIILSGTKIGKGSIVAAGAVVREGEVIPPGSLAAGIPAKIKGTVSPEKIQELQIHAKNYSMLSEEHLRLSQVIA